MIDNAEDLDVVMLIYNLLEYSNNYSMTSESLWDYHRDDHSLDDNANENDADNYRLNNKKTITSKSFKYNPKLVGNTQNDNNTLNAEVVVSLFEQFLEISQFAVD